MKRSDCMPWLAALALSLGLHGHANASGFGAATVRLEVVDRHTGQVIAEGRRGNERWVPGQPGQRYALRIRNQTNARVLVVLSVDGVNVLTGQTASPQQTGYVLAARQSADIAGWRKSQSEVAAFYFTDLGDSYAARTGRPENVGVIGMAVFNEYLPPPQRHSRPVTAAPAPSAAGAHAADRASSIGTGHGQRETSHVTQTHFRRASTSPWMTARIGYDTRERLLARGVSWSPIHTPRPAPRPDPFPNRYVPDP